MSPTPSRRGGFTLVELIVVIAIIGIIAALIVPSVTGYVRTAQEKTHQANAQMLFTAAQLYLTDSEITDALKTDSELTAALNNGALITEGYINDRQIDAQVTYAVTTTDGKRQVTVTYTAAIGGETITYQNGVKQETTP